MVLTVCCLFISNASQSVLKAFITSLKRQKAFGAHNFILQVQKSPKMNASHTTWMSGGLTPTHLPGVCVYVCVRRFQNVNSFKLTTNDSL